MSSVPVSVRSFPAAIAGFAIAITSVAGAAVAQGLDYSGDSRLGAYVDVSHAINGIIAVARGAVVDYVDVSTPSQPMPLSYISVSGPMACLAYTGPFTYAVTRTGRLHVIDSSNPAFPTSIGSTATSLNEARLCQLAGSILTVVDRDQVWLYDVSNPSAVAEFGPFAETAIRATVVGDVLYTLTGSNLRSWDISDPGNPTLIGFASGGMEFALNHDGSRAFLIDPFSTQLRILDISNPAVMTSVDSFTLDDTFSHITYVRRAGSPRGGAPSEILHLTSGETGRTCTFGVDGDTITEGACIEGEGSVDGVRILTPDAASSEDVIKAFWANGLGHYFVFLVATQAWIGLQTKIHEQFGGYATITGTDTLSRTRHVVASEHGVYVSPNRFVEDAVTFEALPNVKKIARLRSIPRGITSSTGDGQELVLAATSSTLHVIDVTDLDATEFIGTWSPSAAFASITALGAEGNLAVVAVTESPNIVVLDLSDPTAPTPAGSISIPGSISDIEMRDGYAFVLREFPTPGGLFVVDLSDPSSPTVVGNAGVRGGAVDLAGDRAYVVNSDLFDPDSGIRIVDISTPTMPAVVGELTDFSALDVVGFEATGARGSARFAAVTDLSKDLVLYDVTDASDIMEVDRVALPEYGFSVDVDGNDLYVAAGAAGHLRIGLDGITPTLPPDTPPDVVPLANAPRVWSRPNPFNARTTLTFELADAGAITLIVFDASGRRVATLRDGPGTAGRHQLAWEGVDDRGVAVPPGVYFVELRSRGASARQKVTVLP